jgi:16S rRNA (guanine(527)-N(7))-methyltransferase RsmG
VAKSTDGVYGPALETLGLAEPAVARLEAYLRLLSAWNLRVNLTGARTPSAQVELLVREVLPLPSLLAAGGLLDVGSGNGSPGLVLGALCPERSVTLLEPRWRRWAFLREAARAMGRPDIQVLRLRHDEFHGPPAANVTVRALRLPAPELARLLAPGGRIIAMGAVPPQHEAFDVRSPGVGIRGGLHVLEPRDVPRGTSGVE